MHLWLTRLVLLALLLWPQMVSTHPFYVSVTELHIFEKRAELSVRIFTDDFESALKTMPGGRKIDLIKREPAQVDSLVARYIRQNLQISLNKAPLYFQYVGYEIEQDATWAHFEANFDLTPRSVRIENTLLFEVLPQQQNIVHVAQGKYKRTRKLSIGEPVMELFELR